MQPRLILGQVFCRLSTVSESRPARHFSAPARHHGEDRGRVAELVLQHVVWHPLSIRGPGRACRWLLRSTRSPPLQRALACIYHSVGYPYGRRTQGLPVGERRPSLSSPRAAGVAWRGSRGVSPTFCRCPCPLLSAWCEVGSDPPLDPTLPQGPFRWYGFRAARAEQLGPLTGAL